MISLFLLILTLIVLIVGNYQNRMTPETNWIGIIIVIILLGIFSTRRSFIYEDFEDTVDKSNPDRKVCFGDTIVLWSFNNTPLRFNGGGFIDLGGRYSKPSDAPRNGWWWEYMTLEDPRELGITIGGNRNPIKKGDKVALRSVYSLSYLSVDDRTGVVASGNRDQKTQFSLTVAGADANTDNYIHYGDAVYLQTFRNTYVTANNNTAIQSSQADYKSQFVITDVDGQGQQVNWARKGIATQSSGYAGNAYPANLSIDGNMNTFAHTGYENGAWWQVNLSQDIQIQSINLTNRRDCCQDRASNFDVIILNDQGQIVATRHFDSAGNGQTPITWSNINQIGRIVKVQLRGSNFLHLADVEVYGQKVDANLLSQSNVSSDLIIQPKSISGTTNFVINPINLPNNNSAQSLTLSMYIKLEATPTTEMLIVHKGEATQQNPSKTPSITILPQTRQLKFYYDTMTTANQSMVLTSNPLTLNEWIHVAYVIDGGLNLETGWKLGKFPQGSYYINSALRQSYAIPSNLIPSNETVVFTDPSILTGLRSMGTFTATQNKPQIRIYLGGNLSQTINLNAQPKLNNGALTLGQSSSWSLPGATCQLDQVKYANYALTSEQIGQLSFRPLSNITKVVISQVTPGLPILSIPHNQLPSLERDFTVQTWLKVNRPTTSNQWTQIFCKGDLWDRAPGLWLHPDSNYMHPRLKTHNSAFENGEGIYKTSLALPNDEWHHVAMTISNRILTFYYDGRQINQNTMTDTALFNTKPLNLGGFDGSMNLFQWSNYAMTSNQIQQSMGSSPDSSIDQNIAKIWTEVGCLNQPPINLHPEWRRQNLSQVRGDIYTLKKKADSGDLDSRTQCYGQFTAGLLNLSESKVAISNKSINDFDIRTHKNFHNYTLTSKIRRCPGPDGGTSLMKGNIPASSSAPSKSPTCQRSSQQDFKYWADKYIK